MFRKKSTTRHGEVSDARHETGISRESLRDSNQKARDMYATSLRQARSNKICNRDLKYRTKLQGWKIQDLKRLKAIAARILFSTEQKQII